jgi:hypothetical protein
MFDPTLGPSAHQKLALQTRRGGTIENTMNPDSPHAGLDLQIRSLRTKYDKAIHREVGPSYRYNCHGLTFAARRTGISDPGQVQKILNDDGYQQLALGEFPLVGDIVVYRENGDIVHSGVVVGSRNQETMVLGKWGDCHEAVHPVYHCPYPNTTASYYRLMK